MTVAEFKKALSEYPDDMEVVVWRDAKQSDVDADMLQYDRATNKLELWIH